MVDFIENPIYEWMMTVYSSNLGNFNVLRNPEKKWCLFWIPTYETSICGCDPLRVDWNGLNKSWSSEDDKQLTFHFSSIPTPTLLSAFMISGICSMTLWWRRDLRRKTCQRVSTFALQTLFASRVPLDCLHFFGIRGFWKRGIPN